MEYFVTSTLKHNGVKYRRGQALDLPEREADALIKAGIIQADALPEEAAAPSNAREALAPKKPKQNDGLKVGGEPIQTGEPSFDDQSSDSPTDAEDVTPPVVSSDELNAPSGDVTPSVEDDPSKDL